MDLQSSINLVGAVLPLVVDFAAFIPGVGQAETAIKVVEDGIKVEQATTAWFNSGAGQATRDNLTKLFADLGIKTDFGDDGHIAVTFDKSNPYSPGFVQGGDGS